MNPHKTQSIQISLELEMQKISSDEIKNWINIIITKSETKELWMENVLSACDLSDAEILNALNAIPFGHPNDDPWEILLRKPLTSKSK
jgi:hypothetical protein